MGSVPLVPPGNGKLRPYGPKGLGASVGDRLVVRDADDERLLSLENPPEPWLAHGSSP